MDNHLQNRNNYGACVVGSGDLLTLTFVVLKLCGVINWSWWWVLSPIWIPITLIAIFFLVVFIYSIIDFKK